MRLIKAFDRRQTDIKYFNAGAIKTILVVSSTALGDTLLSTPAIRAARKAYPSARIVALFNAYNMELFKNNPNINDVTPYYGGYKKFISTALALRSYNFDLALIFHGNEPQATPLCYLSGARFIFKLPNSSDWNFLLSNREPITKWNELRHGIEARLKTAALAGCKADGFKMDLFIENSDTGAASDFLKSVGVNSDDFLIGFQPGASTLSRQWFPDRFVSLGKRLIEKYPFVKILLTGSPDEKALCEAIAKRIGPSAVVSAGAVTLNQGAALIKKLKCFITGDTGPMHIAYAVGTPVVALYAVSDPQRTGPLLDAHKHRVIKKPRYCEPCASKKCEYQKCMEAISVDEVLGAVTGISALPDNSI